VVFCIPEKNTFTFVEYLEIQDLNLGVRYELSTFFGVTFQLPYNF